MKTNTKITTRLLAKTNDSDTERPFILPKGSDYSIPLGSNPMWEFSFHWKDDNPPTSSKILYVPTGVTVTIDADRTVRGLIIDPNGKLIVESGRYLRIQTESGVEGSCFVNRGTLQLNGGYISLTGHDNAEFLLDYKHIDSFTYFENALANDEGNFRWTGFRDLSSDGFYALPSNMTLDMNGRKIIGLNGSSQYFYFHNLVNCPMVEMSLSSSTAVVHMGSPYINIGLNLSLWQTAGVGDLEAGVINLLILEEGSVKNNSNSFSIGGDSDIGEVIDPDKGLVVKAGTTFDGGSYPLYVYEGNFVLDGTFVNDVGNDSVNVAGDFTGNGSFSGGTIKVKGNFLFDGSFTTVFGKEVWCNRDLITTCNLTPDGLIGRLVYDITDHTDPVTISYPNLLESSFLYHNTSSNHFILEQPLRTKDIDGYKGTFIGDLQLEQTGVTSISETPFIVNLSSSGDVIVTSTLTEEENPLWRNATGHVVRVRPTVDVSELQIEPVPAVDAAYNRLITSTNINNVKDLRIWKTLDNGETFTKLASDYFNTRIRCTATPVLAGEDATFVLLDDDCPHPVYVEIPAHYNVWNGSVSNDWDTPANWNDNVVPIGTTAYAAIPNTVATYPYISSDVVDVRGLIVQGGATLTADWGIYVGDDTDDIYPSKFINKGSIICTDDNYYDISARAGEVLEIDTVTLPEGSTFSLNYNDAGTVKWIGNFDFKQSDMEIAQGTLDASGKDIKYIVFAETDSYLQSFLLGNIINYGVITLQRSINRADTWMGSLDDVGYTGKHIHIMGELDNGTQHTFRLDGGEFASVVITGYVYGMHGIIIGLPENAGNTGKGLIVDGTYNHSYRDDVIIYEGNLVVNGEIRTSRDDAEFIAHNNVYVNSGSTVTIDGKLNFKKDLHFEGSWTKNVTDILLATGSDTQIIHNAMDVSSFSCNKDNDSDLLIANGLITCGNIDGSWIGGFIGKLKLDGYDATILQGIIKAMDPVDATMVTTITTDEYPPNTTNAVKAWLTVEACTGYTGITMNLNHAVGVDPTLNGQWSDDLKMWSSIDGGVNWIVMNNSVFTTSNNVLTFTPGATFGASETLFALSSNVSIN